MTQPGPVRRFPALDPEPPPPTARERLVRAGAVHGVVAVVVAGSSCSTAATCRWPAPTAPSTAR